MNKIKQFFQQFWKIKWLRRTLISTFTLLLILLLIPVIIQYSIPYLLVKQGADEAKIEDINLNLFAGTFELLNLQVSSGNNKPARLARLYSDINMLDLVSAKVILHDIQIEGLDIDISRSDDGSIAINGLTLAANNDTNNAEETGVEANSSPDAIAFGVQNLSLKNSFINYRETDFNQNNQLIAVNLSNLKSWDENAIARLKLDSILNKAPFRLDAELNLFNKTRQFKGHASLTDLSFSPYVKFYRDQLDNLQGHLSLQSDFELSIDDSVSARVKNQININDIQLTYKNINQTVKSISWNGNTAYNKESEVSVTGDLQIQNSRTTDNKQDYLISSVDKLTLKNLQQTLTATRFDQLKIDQLKLIDETNDEHFIQFDLINILDAQLNDMVNVNIKKIELDKPDVSLRLTEQKQLAQLEPLMKTLHSLSPPSQQLEQPDTAPDKSSAKPLNITIGQLQLLNPGNIDFTDLSVTPHYKTQLQVNRLDFNHISSVDKAQFTIALKQQEYTTFDIEGSGLLFDPTQYLQLNVKIAQLDLPPVTPYSSQAMGYGMKSGVIDSDIKMTLENREIDSEIGLKIDSIEVVETNAATAEQVSSASGMSIDLAVSSLKDSDNIIDLKLPVKGNIDKPDFDLSLIINKAMGKAMKSATLTYLKQTLQPFGSLITLYSLAKKAANHISLPPLLFKANSTQFKKDQQDLLDKVVKLLSERPGLKIKACGISALQDQQAIRKILLDEEVARLTAINKATQQKAKAEKKPVPELKVNIEEIKLDEKVIQQKMHDLADARAANVKRFLLDKAKLPSNRILNCLSTTNTDEKSQASVELQI